MSWAWEASHTYSNDNWNNVRPKIYGWPKRFQHVIPIFLTSKEVYFMSSNACECNLFPINKNIYYMISWTQ